MKFTQAFEKIKEKIQDVDTTNITDFAIQITLTNKDCGGIFYLQVKDGKLFIEPYDYHDNNAAISIMYGDLNKLLEGRLDSVKATEKGTLQITGDTVGALAILSKLERPKEATKLSVKKKTLAK